MAPKASPASSRGLRRARKPSATNNAAKVTKDVAIKKRGRPRKNPAADALQDPPNAAAQSRYGFRPRRAVAPNATATSKDAPSKQAPAATASKFTGKGSKVSSSANASAESAAPGNVSNARKRRPASRKQKRRLSDSPAAGKANDKSKTEGKAADGYNAMNLQELHERANSYRVKPRNLSERDTMQKLRQYLRATDKRRKKAAEAAAEAQEISESHNSKVKHGTNVKKQAQKPIAQPDLSTKERLEEIWAAEIISRRYLNLPDLPPSAYQDSQEDADDEDATDELTYESEGGTNMPDLQNQVDAVETDEAGPDEETMKQLTLEMSWIGKEEQKRIDELQRKGYSQEEAERIAKEIKEQKERQEAREKKDLQYLAGAAGEMSANAESYWMAKRIMNDIGMKDFRLYQADVLGDGLCAFRAFAVAFYGTDRIRSGKVDRAFETKAMSEVRKVARAWWHRIVDEANRGSEESQSRLLYYRAMNHILLQNPELRMQADAWLETRIGQSPTTVIDPVGESLAAQILQDGVKKVWGGTELMQVLADAFDVEVIIHTCSMAGDATGGWVSYGRGEFGARQVHVCNYQLSNHWTAVATVEEDAVWTHHLAYADSYAGTLPYWRFPVDVSDRYPEVAIKLPPRIPRTRAAPRGDGPPRIKIPRGWEIHRSVRSPRWGDDASPNKSPLFSPTSTKLPSPRLLKKRPSPEAEDKDCTPSKKPRKSKSPEAGGSDEPSKEPRTPPRQTTASNISSPFEPRRSPRKSPFANSENGRPSPPRISRPRKNAGLPLLRGVKRILEQSVELRTIGNNDSPLRQIEVGNGGHSLFRAFGMAYIFPQTIRSGTRNDRHERRFRTRIIKELRAWWQTVTKDRTSPESQARLQYYKAINARLRIDRLGHNDTSSEDESLDELVRQINATETDPVYGDFAMLQVLADAFDVEIILHVPMVADNGPIFNGWRTLSRGEFGARQVHLAFYPNLGRFTALAPVVRAPIWSDHLGRPRSRYPVHGQATWSGVNDRYPPQLHRTGLPRPTTSARRIKIPDHLRNFAQVEDPEFETALSNVPDSAANTTGSSPRASTRKRPSNGPDSAERSPRTRLLTDNARTTSTNRPCRVASKDKTPSPGGGQAGPDDRSGFTGRMSGRCQRSDSAAAEKFRVQEGSVKENGISVEHPDNYQRIGSELVMSPTPSAASQGSADMDISPITPSAGPIQGRR